MGLSERIAREFVNLGTNPPVASEVEHADRMARHGVYAIGAGDPATWSEEVLLHGWKPMRTKLKSVILVPTH